VNEEQRRRRPNMSLPEGAGRFLAATASLVAHISLLICSLLAPCFAQKLPQPKCKLFPALGSMITSFFTLPKNAREAFERQSKDTFIPFTAE